MNIEKDEELENHMREAMEDERKNPPPPEPDSGSSPAMQVEKEPETPKVEAQDESKVDRPRNPDGTFAKQKDTEAPPAKAEEPKAEKAP